MRTVFTIRSFESSVWHCVQIDVSIDFELVHYLEDDVYVYQDVHIVDCFSGFLNVQVDETFVVPVTQCH